MQHIFAHNLSELKFRIKVKIGWHYVFKLENYLKLQQLTIDIIFCENNNN